MSDTIDLFGAETVFATIANDASGTAPATVDYGESTDLVHP